MARETKAHHKSRAGIEPVPRETVTYVKKLLMEVVDHAVGTRWSTSDDDEREALSRQRDRIAKLFGIATKYTP